jgi:hypothetical protein
MRRDQWRERLELLVLLNVQAQGVQWFEEVGSEWERLVRSVTRPPVQEDLAQALALPAGEEIAAALHQTLVSVRTGLE